eukprot:16792-Rhodomonas_salina.1
MIEYTCPPAPLSVQIYPSEHHSQYKSTHCSVQIYPASQQSQHDRVHLHLSSNLPRFSAVSEQIHPFSVQVFPHFQQSQHNSTPICASTCVPQQSQYSLQPSFLTPHPSPLSLHPPSSPHLPITPLPHHPSPFAPRPSPFTS